MQNFNNISNITPSVLPDYIRRVCTALAVTVGSTVSY